MKIDQKPTKKWPEKREKHLPATIFGQLNTPKVVKNSGPTEHHFSKTPAKARGRLMILGKCAAILIN
ncbi:hypothetical protein [Zavarzinella formosa]|uniref:hypothetical protein n=1 Tax=Zavarzinella formosa TaxID=360055 RepID=UPI000372E4E7|nr:hypothetical protein [Zavarzinella formosa]